MTKVIKLKTKTWLLLNRLKNGSTFDECIQALVKINGVRFLRARIKKINSLIKKIK